MEFYDLSRASVSMTHNDHTLSERSPTQEKGKQELKKTARQTCQPPGDALLWMRQRLKLSMCLGMLAFCQSLRVQLPNRKSCRQRALPMGAVADRHTRRRPCPVGATVLATTALALLLAIAANATEVSDETKDMTPKEMNSKAIKLAEADNLKEALVLLERATEASPETAFLHMNLGVTLMRAGRLDDAKVRFLKALKLNPSDPDAIENLVELCKFRKLDPVEELTAEGIPVPRRLRRTARKRPRKRSKRRRPAVRTSVDEGGQASVLRAAGGEQVQPNAEGVVTDNLGLSEVHIRHTVRRLPRIPAHRLYDAEFRVYAEGRKPFVLTGLIQQWRNTPTLWSPEYFADKFRDSMVDFYPSNLDKSG